MNGLRPESRDLAWTFVTPGSTPFPPWARVNIAGVLFKAFYDEATGAYLLAAPMGAQGIRDPK